MLSFTLMRMSLPRTTRRAPLRLLPPKPPKPLPKAPPNAPPKMSPNCEKMSSIEKPPLLKPPCPLMPAWPNWS